MTSANHALVKNELRALYSPYTCKSNSAAGMVQQNLP